MTSNMKSLSLDIGVLNKHQWVDAKQFDNKARRLIITLLDNGEQFVPEKGTVVMFRALKPDGKSVEYEATINEDGTITVELSEQALAVKGVVKADISLVGSDGSRLSTASFFLQNQEAPIGEDVGSESQILVFERLTSQAVEAANSAAKAANSTAKDAETAESARTEATEANENVQEIAKSLEQTVKDANTATSEALSAAEKANEAASLAENVPNDLMLTDRLLQLTTNGEAVGEGAVLPRAPVVNMIDIQSNILTDDQGLVFGGNISMLLPDAKTVGFGILGGRINSDGSFLPGELYPLLPPYAIDGFIGATQINIAFSVVNEGMEVVFDEALFKQLISNDITAEVIQGIYVRNLVDTEKKQYLFFGITSENSDFLGEMVTELSQYLSMGDKVCVSFIPFGGGVSNE